MFRKDVELLKACMTTLYIGIGILLGNNLNIVITDPLSTIVEVALMLEHMAPEILILALELGHVLILFI